MHVKEYRIPLPLTVEEYRIAQLYMIQKKSREESSGAGSGVEIIKNEPYEDGPGGCGQYTYKIYHIGSHLPNWFRAILPKSALRVEEEAWNAYPYTKTIFRCPFIEKFSITIETVYKPDGGTQENVFGLGQRELKTRLVDLLDFVKDSLPSGDYKKEEDPKLYVSSATGRGPLTNDWLKERMVHGASGGPVMCAYKLCYVEFRYWGMQSKIERFIHDTALRKTMVRAHRQAWAWQDEWHGLTIDDIRDLEMQTQQALAQKMEHAVEDSPQQHPFSEIHSDTADSSTTLDSSANNNSSPDDAAYSAFRRVHSDTPSANPVLESPSQLSRISWSSLEKVNEDSDDEEFFDAQDEFENGSDRSEDAVANSLFSQNEEEETLAASNTLSVESSTSSIDGSARSSPNKIFSRQATIEDMDDVDGTSCDISVLFLVLHGGNALLVESDKNSKFSDLSTWKATFDKVVSRHYPNFLGRYSIKLVACPPMHSEALNLLASINPLSNEGSDSGSHIYNEYFPISAVPLLAVQTPEYQDCMLSVANRANKAYRDFLLSDEGNGFSGQVVLVGDCMGSVLAFDILCVAQPELSPQLEDKKKYASDTDLNELPESKDVTDFSASMPATRLSKMASPLLLRSPASSAYLPLHQPHPDSKVFEFEVSDFFMLGSPLALVLAQRFIKSGREAQVRPNCCQVYNLFHATDPCAGRVESLLESSFSQFETVRVPRYTNYPLGDGLSNSLFDCLQRHGAFNDVTASPVRSGLCSSLVRQGSNASYLSTNSVDLNLDNVASVARKWWGNKRLDYTMYCPEALQHFPASALPHVFHANFWESLDAASFILRQLLIQEGVVTADLQTAAEHHLFKPQQPREKWINKRTAIKTKNIAPNHRGNDVLVTEDKPQRVSARFMYGQFDLVTLSNEKVDMHIVRDQSTKQWDYMGTAVTDKYGRVTFQIPAEMRLPQGLHPVKMVVRGDHTFTDLSLLVLPPNAGVVLFSIDGSFAASVSLMGKDPKVRPGAVDVVRYWQDLGYCILYISGRPDMQLRRVVSWLAQHNFPHGMLAFMDGLTADPMKQKSHYLKNLVKESAIDIVASYGSFKDIAVYQSLNLEQKKIYVIGKVPKKAYCMAQVLDEGYAAHLKKLHLTTQISPSAANTRFFVPKSSFILPGQKSKKPTSKNLRSTLSVGGVETIPTITINKSGNTTIDAGAEGGRGNFSKVRGRSPRLVSLRRIPDDSPPVG